MSYDDRKAGDRRRAEEDRRALAERTLPHSLQAEKAVLGAVLVNPELLPLLPPALTGNAFYRQAHQHIFDALCGLHGRGSAVDFLTLVEELTRLGQLEECGGPAYLSSLTDGVPRSTNAPHYADIVTEHATRRALIYLANRMLAQAYEAEAPPAQLLEDAQRGIVQVASEHVSGSAVKVSEVLPSVFALLEAQAGRGATCIGVPSGYEDLDIMTAGFQDGDLVLVAARPSMGKTALCMNVAERVAETGRHTLVFSLEMSKEALLMRMVSSRARVDSHRMRTGHLSEKDYGRISHALGELNEMPLYIDDTPGLPVTDLPVRARRARVEMGGLRLIIVDYLQLLRTRQRFNSKNDEVGFVSGVLKQTARELGVPVIALSQLSRAVEQRGRAARPQLSDLRDSGNLEQDADVVMFIHRHQIANPDDEDDGIAEIIIGKQRNGPVGTVRLCFIKEHTRFESLVLAR